MGQPIVFSTSFGLAKLMDFVPSISREEEIAALKNRARWLTQKLAEIKRRIEPLEKSEGK